MIIYTKFRADGWPLCPACGGDGLWMLHIQPQEDAPPKLPESIKQIQGCALCEWKPAHGPVGDGEQEN